ncbi:MAG: TM2 domain-containing protein [Shewanella sp.]|uniref:TM2 domain-containing protein n=1 Tax=Shewanella sp. TaxID=50422 RepID=UPI00300215FF
MELQFSVLGRELTFSKSRKEYINLRGEFAKLARSASAQFGETYNDYEGISQFIDKGMQDGLELISEALSIASNRLVELGDYSSTVESFYEEYFKPYSEYEQKFDVISEEFMQIYLDDEELKNYRSERKGNRGRLIGGGFGVGGAVQGMAMAGAANMAVGAVHSVFNFVGNVISDSKKQKKLDELFNENTLELIQNAIHQDILNVHLALFNALADKGLVSKDGAVTNEDYKKSTSILQNVKKGVISDKEKIKTALFQSIQLNPFNEEAYHILMTDFPESQKEMNALAIFCMVSIEQTKMDVLNVYYNEVDMDSEESIKATIEKIEMHASEIGLDNCDVAIKNVVKQGAVRLEEMHLINSGVEITKVNDCTLQSKHSYEILYNHIKFFFIANGAVIKIDDVESSMIEAAFKYGINIYGLRVIVEFEVLENGIVEMVFQSGFKDSFDALGVAKKKTDELIHKLLDEKQLKTAKALTEQDNSRSKTKQSLTVENDEQFKGSKELTAEGGIQSNDQNGLAKQHELSSFFAVKNKVLAGFLALILGCFGAHKFYLGSWGIGIIYFVFFFIMPGVLFIIAVIEAVRYFTMSESSFDEKYKLCEIKPFEFKW